MRIEAAFASALALAALASSERDARAFCRTTTCPLPAGFAPSPTECQPPDMAATCAAQSPPSTDLVLWWRNACVSYDIQQSASRRVPYGDAVQAFAAAFAKWTGTTCAGGARVSIDVMNLGPVACDMVQYSSDQGNQHVILFRDDGWPYPNDLNNTLGLTTITFDSETGEIYDADMEINSTVPLTVSGPVPPQGYDFLSIITHETGHFLGMAHSGLRQATMFSRYTPGTTTMRTLTSDDTAGICSIYLPGGKRSVDPSVAPGGSSAEDACDPTPRHGFQSQCAQPQQSKGCAVARVGDRAPSAPLAVGPALLALAAFGRRARRGVRA